MLPGETGYSDASLKIRMLDQTLLELLDSRKGSDGIRAYLKIDKSNQTLSTTLDPKEASSYAEVARLIHGTVREAIKFHVDENLVQNLKEHFNAWKKGERREVRFLEEAELIFPEEGGKRAFAPLVDERNYGRVGSKSKTFHQKELDRLMHQGADKFGELGEVIEREKLLGAFGYVFSLHFGKTKHSLQRGEVLDESAKQLVLKTFDEALQELGDACRAHKTKPQAAAESFEQIFLEKLKRNNQKNLVMTSQEFKSLAGGLVNSIASEDAPEIDPTTGNFRMLCKMIKEGSWNLGEREVSFSTLDFKRMKRAEEAFTKIIRHPVVINDMKRFLEQDASREELEPLEEADVGGDFSRREETVASSQREEPAAAELIAGSGRGDNDEAAILELSPVVEREVAASDVAEATQADLDALAAEFDKRFALWYGKTKHSPTRGELMDAQAKQFVSAVFREMIRELGQHSNGGKEEGRVSPQDFAQRFKQKLLDKNMQKFMVDPEGFVKIAGGLARSLSSNDAPQIDPYTGTFSALFRSYRDGWRQGEKQLVFSTMDYKRMKKASDSINYIFANPEFAGIFSKIF